MEEAGHVLLSAGAAPARRAGADVWARDRRRRRHRRQLQSRVDNIVIKIVPLFIYTTYR